jgi:2'-5' RNA ligase
MDAAGAAVPPFRLSLGALGTFPNEHRPRVVWAGLAGDLPVLSALHKRLDDRLRALDLPLEGRTFRPHITLGRASVAWSAAQLAALRRLLSAPPVVDEPWRAAELHLVRSELHPAGAHYTTLYTSALKG